MAEGVQAVMEDMLPDLLDFVGNRVFTQEEVDDIVSRRQAFEYKLARRTPSKRQFIKAIQYELSLETQRAARKSDLQITRPFASDHSSTFYLVLRRITNLFHRLLRRFPGDIASWKEFIGFCLRKRLSKPLETALARSLQLNPCCEELWLLAVAVEEVTKPGNWDTRRALFQRAVRLNSRSERLWEGYFAMEVDYWEKTKEKEEVVQLVWTEAGKHLGTESMRKLRAVAQRSPSLDRLLPS